MSASEGSLGSSGGSVAAPPPAPPAAAASDVGTAAPSTAHPAVEPAAPPPPPAAAPSTAIPGASTTAAGANVPPKTIDEARAIFRQQVGLDIGANPEVVAPPEAQPTSEAAQLLEVPEPIPAVAAPPEPEEVEPPLPEPGVAEPQDDSALEALADDEDDLSVAFTPEELERRYSGRLNKKAKADIVRRDAQRVELLQKNQEVMQKLGGQPGLDLAANMSAIIWKDDVTKADAEQIVDLLTLPEHGGNAPLARMVASHLINTTIEDETAGPEFANQLITGQWGRKADGSAFDFAGMKPLELNDLLMHGVQAGLIDVEFLKNELDSMPRHEPSKRELELIRENEQLREQGQLKETEQKRERDRAKNVYTTQAVNWVQNYLYKAILPDAQKANWAAVDGEEGPSVEEKRALGELVADHINFRLFGSTGAPSQEFQALMRMINEMTAFSPETGLPTPRFIQKMEPLANKAKALFLGKQRVLNPRIKWTSETSRNAQLVAKNGSQKIGAPPQPQVQPPPVRQPVETQVRTKSTEELLAEERAKFAASMRRAQAEAGVGQL